MFRRWLDLLGCKIYGHHWWVTSGVDAEGDDEGLNVYLSIAYGPCKRCDADNPDPHVGTQRTHRVTVDDYKVTMDKDGANLDIHHKVEAFDLDDSNFRNYRRKESE